MNFWTYLGREKQIEREREYKAVLSELGFCSKKGTGIYLSISLDFPPWWVSLEYILFPTQLMFEVEKSLSVIQMYCLLSNLRSFLGPWVIGFIQSFNK